MKRTILFSIGLFACLATAGAQDAAQNYVLRRTMLDEAGTGSMDNVTYCITTGWDDPPCTWGWARRPTERTC